MKKIESRKLYKIGHLTKLLGVTSRTIRYYEQFGLLPHVKRSEGNVRLFNEEDLEIIKKIRLLQREQFLPLDVIKEKLFGKKTKTTTKDSVVLTDSVAVLTTEMEENLPVFSMPIRLQYGPEEVMYSQKTSVDDLTTKSKTYKLQPILTPPTVDDFVKQYLSFYDKGYVHVYSIHSSSLFYSTYENAYKASLKVSDKIDITVVDSKTMGPGLGLLIHHVASAIQAGESREKIDILIAKEQPLIFTLFAINSLTPLLTDANIDRSNIFQSTFSTQIQSYKSVMALQSNTGEMAVLDCCKTSEEVLSLIMDQVREEIRSRGGYVSGILIMYHYLYAEAAELTNRLKSEFPKTTVTLEKDPGFLAINVGPESLSVSIV